MFKSTNFAKVVTGVFGALLFSSICLAGALAPSQVQVAAHAVA
jgi:hypothetical protein